MIVYDSLSSHLASYGTQQILANCLMTDSIMDFITNTVGPIWDLADRKYFCVSEKEQRMLELSRCSQVPAV